MKHIVCFSGGKDSTALVLWAKENLTEFTTVFCDTGWEHPITYAYIEEINRTLLDGKLVTLKSEKYPQGFVQLCVEKGRVPSVRMRFCTDKLKTAPIIKWLKTIDDEATLYQGIRADESAARSRMAESCFDDNFDAEIRRPLLRWSAEDCFAMMRKHGVQPNPLYLMGAGRVGCFPCIMVNMRELKAYLNHPINGPMLKTRVLELERSVGGSFFSPGDVPERFCSGRTEEGKIFPWAQDVFRYIDSVNEDQLPLLPERSCMSVYNLCE